MALKNVHFFVIFGVFVLDQFTKFAAKKFVVNAITIFPFLKLTLVENTGVAFGVLSSFSARWLLVFVSVIAVIFLARYARSTQDEFVLVCISLIIGGALGNLVDRLLFGFVIDFIDVIVWPVFNVADTAITIGVLGLVFKKRLNR